MTTRSDSSPLRAAATSNDPDAIVLFNQLASLTCSISEGVGITTFEPPAELPPAEAPPELPLELAVEPVSEAL